MVTVLKEARKLSFYRLLHSADTSYLINYFIINIFIMNTQQTYKRMLARVQELTSGLLTETAKNELVTKAEELEKLIVQCQYIKVPLVGIFNAGKSSLLNKYIEKPGLLPVDVLPETTVACELYYEETERADHYRDGILIGTKPTSEIKAFQTSPGDIMKVYVNSPVVKSLQEKGIILVDMPGIDSGIQQHDAAIFNYIQLGTAFILLVDAEQGTLRTSTLFFLNELKKYNLKPAILLSKIDRLPETEVAKIKEHVLAQVTRADYVPYVSQVSALQNNIEGLTNYLDTLDADALLALKLGGLMRNLIASVMTNLNMQIELKGQDKEGIEEKLRRINEELSDARLSLPTHNNQADTPQKSCQDILDNVRDALQDKAYDIAAMIVSKEPEEHIQAALMSVIRSEIITSFQEESEQYATALGGAVNDAVRKVTGITFIDNAFLENYSEIISYTTTYLSELTSRLPGFWGKFISLLLPYVKDIIDWLFGKTDDEKIEEVKDKIMQSCIPQIEEELRPNVLKLVIDNQNRISVQLQQEMIHAFEKVKEGLQEKMADTERDKQEVEKKLEALNGAVAELVNLQTSL